MLSKPHPLRGDDARPGGGNPSGDPLELIAREHLRQRAMLAALDRLAEAPAPEPAEAGAALAALRDEWTAHVRDEAEDLFPLLLRRAAPEDEIGALLTRLAAAHDRGPEDAAPLVEALSPLAGGAALAPRARARLAAFAAAERRRLIYENAILLPLARARLTARDKLALAGRMAARRNRSNGPRP